MKCTVYETGTLKDYQHVAIAAIFENKWIFVRHKDCDTWEIAGGHIEKDETPLAAAQHKLV